MEDRIKACPKNSKKLEFSKHSSQSVAFSLTHYVKGETKEVKNLDLLETLCQIFLGSNSKSFSLAKLLHFSERGKYLAHIVVIFIRLKK